MKNEKGLSEIALTILMIPIMLAVTLTVSVMIDSRLIKAAKSATEGTNQKAEEIQKRNDELKKELEIMESEYNY